MTIGIMSAYKMIIEIVTVIKITVDKIMLIIIIRQNDSIMTVDKMIVIKMTIDDMPFYQHAQFER
jgi:hypothetical protein